MHPPRPAVRRQETDDIFKLALHLGWHVGWRDAKILKVGRRKYQHFAGAVMAALIVALLVLRRLRPVNEVLLFSLRLLGEQIVNEANGELAFVRQLLNDGVILW